MVTDRVCKCCGQTRPLPFDIGMEFSKRTRELIDAIYLAGAYGIQTDRLIDKIYGADPNGGPEDARKTIHVRICQVNKKLRQRGWHIHARGDHHGIYVIEKISLSAIATAAVIRSAIGAS